MKQIFLVFIVLMIGVGGYFFLIKSSPSVSERLTIEKEWVVDTVRVAKIDSQPTLHLSGKIVAAREADLRPLVEGRIIEIGDNFHEPPNILHYGKKNTGAELKPGMTFTIEPMINSGKYEVKILDDGWTAVSKDKSLSAQFEHTVGIKDNGYEIFTESVSDYVKPPYN